MGDYFDDEDLINEYMEQNFEPPSEYDEEFLEAELGAAKGDGADKKTEPEPMDEDPPQAHVQQDASAGQNMTVPTSVNIKPPEPNPDVYSFERYERNNHLIVVRMNHRVKSCSLC